MEDLKFIKEPLVSIIITYYNMGKFINNCIESINFQSYKNFEIIIVNDCSDVENSSVLNDIKCAKIVNLEKNQGQLCALCEGLKIASGEFVCMVDADDVLLPNYLKTLLCAHLNNNFALISSQKGEINEMGEILSLNKQKKEISYQEIEDLFKTKDYFKLQEVKAPFALWSWTPSTGAMWRKSAIDIVEYFPDKQYWRSGADKVIFSLLHLIGGSATIDSVLFLYRIHSCNNFNDSNFIGNKKYLSETTVNRLINWNIKLRLDSIKMFIANKNVLIKKYNKINYIKMLLKVVFCFNIQVCAKIIKTFAHRLIKI